MAVLPNGRLVSAGFDGEIKLWLVNEKELIASLCLRAGRNLTKDEWDRYIGSGTPWQPSCRAFGVPSNWRTVDENESGVLPQRVRSEVWEKTHHSQLPGVNTSLIGDDALNPEPVPTEAAEASKATPPPAPAAERQSREDLLWELAQHSNLRADYQAYLDAFPNGFFAQMAKNHIASLGDQGAVRSQVEPEKDWKAEIGTAETEKALDLTPADQKEIQQRLAALGLYKGPPTGALDEPTRSAVTEWQKSRGAALSSYLGPLELAELRAESEDAFQKLLAAQAAKAPAKEPAKVAARPSESGRATARHVVSRSSSSSGASAAAVPAAAPSCNGNPIWCRKAGLPVNSGAAPTGRPPEFMGGYVTGVGALMRGFRHY